MVITLGLAGGTAWFLATHGATPDVVVQVAAEPSPEPAAIVAVSATPTAAPAVVDVNDVAASDRDAGNAGGTPEEVVGGAPPTAAAPTDPQPSRPPRRERAPARPTPRPTPSPTPSGAPPGPALTAEHPQLVAAQEAAQAQYRSQIVDLESQLRAMDTFLGRLDSLRSMLTGLADGPKPPLCDGSGVRAMGHGSDLGWIVSQEHGIRDQIERLCEPFENLENTPTVVRNDLDRFASTIDRAEEMAANRSVSSNTPTDVADDVVSALQETRNAVRGVAEGRRPFPCNAAVFRRLRLLKNAGNSYAGSAAHRVMSVRDRICQRLGTDLSALRTAEGRFRQNLDDREGTVRQNHRSVSGVRDQFRAFLQ